MDGIDVIDEASCDRCENMVTHHINSKTGLGKCIICNTINEWGKKEIDFLFRYFCPRCISGNLIFHWRRSGMKYELDSVWCVECRCDLNPNTLVKVNAGI